MWCTVQEFGAASATHDIWFVTGVHSEGGVWATLWGLLMWPVLFADVPEVAYLVAKHHSGLSWIQCDTQSEMNSQGSRASIQVFRTPFQSGPLDLGTDAFFPARETLINSRLQEIRRGSDGR
jgi:fanconi-associated nuclease 1